MGAAQKISTDVLTTPQNLSALIMRKTILLSKVDLKRQELWRIKLTFSMKAIHWSGSDAVFS